MLSQHHIYPPTVEDEEVLSEEWGRLIYSFLLEAVEIAFGSQRAKAIIKDGTVDCPGVHLASGSSRGSKDRVRPDSFSLKTPTPLDSRSVRE